MAGSWKSRVLADKIVISDHWRFRKTWAGSAVELSDEVEGVNLLFLFVDLLVEFFIIL